MPINRKGGGVAPGNIDFFAASTPPAGWIKANGAAISRTIYGALFNVVGTTYGAGDGSTTFNVPDLRGEFVRGWDDARGVDSGRAMGTAQAGEVQAHSHGMPMGSGSAISSSSVVGRDDWVEGPGVNTYTTGGAETRPRNVSLLACIKF